jgi:hypothetical protein
LQAIFLPKTAQVVISSPFCSVSQDRGFRFRLLGWPTLQWMWRNAGKRKSSQLNWGTVS